MYLMRVIITGRKRVSDPKPTGGAPAPASVVVSGGCDVVAVGDAASVVVSGGSDGSREISSVSITETISSSSSMSSFTTSMPFLPSPS